ncbi:DUF2200 domain-containing protein [Thorsellia anophelis]|uniref:DUF2200 domain-containing protein n=1 Tax=Thorsellia anophelis DSM 18579 TaxID=1123402 RepID=A0A1I0DWQ8_9GAMM|nr:DUF2200 domain-containing protein [Thorsellia anophelis]SET36968.1 hypothetical protein SAMN02583745_02161 [Thorsellia anophelis DSM 18579]
MIEHKIFTMNFANIYSLYIKKITKKGRTIDELHDLIYWLTGFDGASLDEILKKQVSFRDFFHIAPALNPERHKIKGSICGIKIESISDPLMKEIRYLDKIVDDLAKGKTLERIKTRL